MVQLPAEDRALMSMSRTKYQDAARQARALLTDLSRIMQGIARHPLNLGLWIRSLRVSDALASDVASRNPCRRLIGMASDELDGLDATTASQIEWKQRP